MITHVRDARGEPREQTTPRSRRLQIKAAQAFMTSSRHAAATRAGYEDALQIYCDFIFAPDLAAMSASGAAKSANASLFKTHLFETQVF